MKLIKKLSLILLIIMFCFIIILFLNNVLALNADIVVDKLEDPATRTPEAKLQEVANPILTVLQVVSIGIAVILIVNDGIKYITASDNADKANLKRKIVYYIIGAVFIFGPITITKHLISLAEVGDSLVN